jgi:hypothetical protein
MSPAAEVDNERCAKQSPLGERVTFPRERVTLGPRAQLQAALSKLESSREGLRLNNERQVRNIAASDDESRFWRRVWHSEGRNAQMRGDWLS